MYKFKQLRVRIIVAANPARTNFVLNHFLNDTDIHSHYIAEIFSHYIAEILPNNPQFSSYTEC